MGKDKKTWKNIRKQEIKDTVIRYYLESLASELFEDETARDVFACIVSTHLQGFVESTEIIVGALNL